MTTATIKTALLLTLLPAALAGCGSQPPAPAGATSSTEAAAGVAADPGTPAAPAAPAAAGAPLSSASAPAPVAVAPAPPPANVEVTLPSGTDLSIELLTDLSTETATTETAVRGRLLRAVVVGERTAFPAGATLTGMVTNAVRPGKVKGRALLSLQFTSITIDEEGTPISTDPITVEGEGDAKGDATKIGVGAGVGAVVGGILGGGSGAAKGAAIGGGAGTGVVLATRGKEVVLAAGTTLSTELSAAKVVEVPR